MQRTQQKQVDLKQMISTIFKRKWLILTCIILVLAPIYYYNKVSLPVYEASTLIVCEETKATMPGFEMAQSRLGNTFITNQIQEIKSWSLANEVAESLPDNIFRAFPAVKQKPTREKENDFLTSLVRGSIDAQSIPNSDVIRINASASDAEAARIISNTTAEVLKERNLESKLSEIHNVRKTIEDQLVDYKQKVEETEQSLKNYKEKNKVTFLDQESTEIFKRITEAETEYNKVKTEHDAAQKRLLFIQNKLSKERADLVPKITTTTSPWAQRLKQSLIELEVQYTTLRVQDYDDNHPQMKKLKQQIEETKKNLEKETLKIAKGENTLDPLSQIQRDLEEIAALEVEIHTYEAQEKALLNVLNNYNGTLKSLPDKELELGRLMRDKSVADNIYTMLLQKREEAKLQEAEKAGNIRIIDPARTPKSPVRPRKMLNLIIGFIVGTSLGVGLAFLIESFDNTIKTTEEVEANLKIPVFSTIPRIKEDKNGKFLNLGKEKDDGENGEMTSKLVAGRDSKSPATEAFRLLRTSIQFAELNNPVKTIMVTSPNPGDGKSLTTANLAIVTAQMGLKTILIDLDLRKPVQHTLFGKDLEPGVMDVVSQLNHARVLSRKSDTESADEIRMIQSNIKKMIHHIHIKNLDLLTCGTIPSNPSEILGSETMKAFLNSLKENYQVILLDTPPALTVTDAAIIGRAVEGIILVIRAGKISQQELVRAKDVLQRLKGNIIGTVLNGVDVSTGYYSKYSYYN